MLRPLAIWLLVAGLAATRLLGLHLHVCAGLESVSHAHESAHYADRGLLFGEEHFDDHSDNLEIELAAVGFPAHYPAPPKNLESDTSPPLIGADRLSVTLSSGWLTVRVPRGPPALHPSRPAFFTPALRGPPKSSLA